MLKGLLRIRRYQQETPCALQEADVRSWLRFGEAYSALRDWRPIPAALLSQSVVQCSGTEEFLPTTTARLCGRPRRERNSPDKQRSIRKKTCTVKLSSKQVCGNKCRFSTLASTLPVKHVWQCPDPYLSIVQSYQRVASLASSSLPRCHDSPLQNYRLPSSPGSHPSHQPIQRTSRHVFDDQVFTFFLNSIHLGPQRWIQALFQLNPLPKARSWP